MIHVRRHVRITASGKRAAVRAYDREGDDGLRPVPEWSRPVHVGDLPPEDDGGGQAVTEDWWADDSEELDEPHLTLRERFRFATEPAGSDDFGKSRAEWKAAKDLADEQGTSPDKREVRREARRLKDEQAEAMVRFSYAPTVTERDAAEADYERVTAELRALTGKGGFADWGDR